MTQHRGTCPVAGALREVKRSAGSGNRRARSSCGCRGGGDVRLHAFTVPHRRRRCMLNLCVLDVVGRARRYSVREVRRRPSVPARQDSDSDGGTWSRAPSSFRPLGTGGRVEWSAGCGHVLSPLLARRSPTWDTRSEGGRLPPGAPQRGHECPDSCPGWVGARRVELCARGPLHPVLRTPDCETLRYSRGHLQGPWLSKGEDDCFCGRPARRLRPFSERT